MSEGETGETLRKAAEGCPGGDGGLSVTQIALELGYSSTSAFTYAFRSEMGHSPQAHRDGLAAPARASSNGSQGN